MKLRLLNNQRIRDKVRNNGMEEAYSWTLAFPPNKNGEISDVLAPPEYCRESLMSNIFGAVSYKGKNKVLRLLKGSKGKSYLLFTYMYEMYDHEDDTEKFDPKLAKELRSQLVASCKVLNMVEEEVKWPKTCLIFPDHEWKNLGTIAIFKVSNKWTYSPYMLSLVILILRSSLFTNVHKMKSIPELKDLRKKMCRNRCSGYWSDKAETKDFAAQTFKEWIPVLKNFNAIHKNTDWISNFSRSSYGAAAYYYHTEGILTLVDGNAKNQIIFDNYERVLKREKKN
jgi:hypothetical protein